LPIVWYVWESIDGSFLNNPDVSEHDVLRQKEIETWGYTINRVTNDDVIKNVESVVEEIRKKVLEIKSNQNS
jgi:leucyl-tRNA synthetase